MKHITKLAHIALFTKDLEASVRFYETLGGTITDRADVPKPNGQFNHIVLVELAGFVLEIIKPHDGVPVTAEGGLFPHIALEVDDIDAAIEELKELGITSFRNPEPMTMPIFGGIRNVFFFGPGGELIEFLQKL